MKNYDPLKTPEAGEWLELDEQMRIVLVERYHKKARIAMPNYTVHAAMHAAVENQLAEAMPDVQDALSRLMADGLDRHDAIHAIAWVLSEHFWRLLQKEPIAGDPNEAYLREIRAVTAKKWLDSAK